MMKIENSVIDNFALMSVHARELTVNYASINDGSKGDCTVRVEDEIQYSIHGMENVYLCGNPYEISQQDVTSSGQLIHLH